ncbi:MAG: arylsulfatase [Kiritimatiellaeota bacterium]|nr:arylsulfatase [Kiritimatiellota bacterium]
MTKTADRPNFILIMTDQQRGDCLSLAGHPVLLTPNMDSIGGQGVFFRKAYSTCPSCIPARRSLMAGQFPATHGMVGFRDNVHWEAPPTLPEVLRNAGYHTAIVGRNMHLYPRRRRYGFDEMVIHPTDYDRYVADNQTGDRMGGMAHGISGNGWTARPWHLDEKLHLTTWTVTEALRFLERRDPACPFFLTVSFNAPHPPLTPPAFYLDRYLRLDLPGPAIGDWAVAPPDRGLGSDVQSDHVDLRGEALHAARAGYYGLINHVDDQLYRLLGAHTGLDPKTRRRTYIIFTTDHGEMLGDHYLFRKCYPYEGSARIPLLIQGPEVKSGVVCDQVVCLEDIMPTVLDLAGCEIPATAEGRSLAPILRGEAKTLDRTFLHGEHATCYSYTQANHYLTDGREKYVWFPSNGAEQLFDLTADPCELCNLAVVPAWRERLMLWRARLIDRLAGRPEGFTDGARLIPERPHTALLPHARGASPPG